MNREKFASWVDTPVGFWVCGGAIVCVIFGVTCLPLLMAPPERVWEQDARVEDVRWDEFPPPVYGGWTATVRPVDPNLPHEQIYAVGSALAEKLKLAKKTAHVVHLTLRGTWIEAVDWGVERL